MGKYRVIVDLSATIDLVINAESPKEAEQIASAMLDKEDTFIDEHRDEIYIWCPVIEFIEEEEED